MFFFFYNIPNPCSEVGHSSGNGPGPAIKSRLITSINDNKPLVGARLDSEPVVFELRRGLEGLEPQYPAGVSPLFGAIQRLAAGPTAKVNKGRVS